VDTPILGDVKLAVQLPEPPAATVEGVQFRLDSSTASDKEMGKVCELPFSVAVIVAVEPAENVPAWARNWPEDDPPETANGEETVRAGLLLERMIEAVVPGGTTSVRFTVQVV